MTNAPANRKTHIIRILGTNKNGDVLPDIWLDIERIDEAKTVFQSAETNWQGSVRRLKWLDDPDSDNFEEDGPKSRKSRIIKVCSPDEPDQSDPEEWIPVRVIDKMRSTIGDQGSVGSFNNSESTAARIVKQRRILHYDTSIDDDAQAAFDADPTRKVYVAPAERYSRKDGSKDDGQWIEHEVITFLKNRVNNQTMTGQGGDEGKQTKLLNQYLIDESEEAKLEIVGNNNINPPWRLDPFQSIVNVQMGAAATEFSVGNETGLVQQVPATVPDTDKMLISFFVRIPQATFDYAAGRGYQIDMIDFGANDSRSYEGNEFFGGGTVFRASSGIYTTGPDSLTVFMSGGYRSVTIFTPIGDYVDEFDFGGHLLTTDRVYSITAGASRDGGSLLSADKWHHILVVVDTSESTIITNNASGRGLTSADPYVPATVGHCDSAPRIQLFVDNRDYSPTSMEFTVGSPIDAGDGLGALLTVNQEFYGRVLPDFSPSTSGLGISWGVPCTGDLAVMPGTTSDAGLFPDGPIYVYAGSPTTIQPWKIGINGLGFGIPQMESSLEDVPGEGVISISTDMEMQCFQMWTNVAPDLRNTSVRGAFLKINDDGTGSPAPVSAAEALYGEPVYRFNSARFARNSGSAGDVATVGDIRTFSPPARNIELP
jgi:hypothetical protein